MATSWSQFWSQFVVECGGLPAANSLVSDIEETPMDPYGRLADNF